MLLCSNMVTINLKRCVKILQIDILHSVVMKPLIQFTSNIAHSQDNQKYDVTH